MRAPAFWRTRGLPARLLAPLGAIYGAVTARRMRREGVRAEAPVVCIGNFTAGGAGKTPTALALADALAAQGRRPAFLSRGYGGAIREPTRVDLNRHRADMTGDEPLLLARRAPTVVSPDRLEGARLAAALGDVVVMDDGLQNPSLAKDLRLAVVDGGFGVGNGLCLPAGPLRAPLETQLDAVDAVVVVGPGAPGAEVGRLAASRGLPVLQADIAPDSRTVAALRRGKVLAFAGIGRPEKMFETLRAAGVLVAEEMSFPDHHPFTRAEVASLLARARRKGLRPVTTTKDWVRVSGLLAPGEEHDIVALPVTLEFRDPAALGRLLAERLRRPALRPSA